MFDYLRSMRTWERHDPDRYRPIAAPLDRCAELLGVGLATIQRIAANVEPAPSDGQTMTLRQTGREGRLLAGCLLSSAASRYPRHRIHCP
jgi:hypothetical protein